MVVVSTMCRSDSALSISDKVGLQCIYELKSSSTGELMSYVVVVTMLGNILFVVE